MFNDMRDNFIDNTCNDTNAIRETAQEAHKEDRATLVKPLKYGQLKESILKLQERFERKRNEKHIKGDRLLPG